FLVGRTHAYGIIILTFSASALPRIPVLRSRAFCFGFLAENIWRAYACLNLTLPLLVTEKRLAAVRLVLIFGMVVLLLCLNFLFRPIAASAAPTCCVLPSAACLRPARCP